MHQTVTVNLKQLQLKNYLQHEEHNENTIYYLVVIDGRVCMISSPKESHVEHAFLGFCLHLLTYHHN